MTVTGDGRVDRVHQALDDLMSSATWSLTVAERAAEVAGLVRLVDRVQARLFALIAEADRVGLAADAGAASTAGWVRAVTGLTGAESTRLVRQAATVEAHPETLEALAAGDLHAEQALVIAAAVDALPAEVADHTDAAEEHLLGLAGEHDARALRILGRRLVEVVAPDLADQLLARQLEAEERDAARSASLRLWDDGAGSTHGRFKIPALQGAMLRAMVDALANPARPDPLPRHGPAASPHTHALAFAELIERYPAGKLPQTGGVTATVVVTIPLETLEGRLTAAGVLGTGQALSPGQARRLACAAGVIPAVLGTRSEVLDLGRKHRTHNRAQRLAMALQQGGLCNIGDCERPASWADAHHRHPWSQGGPTSTQNGELICPRHHTLVHQGFTYPRRT